MTGFIIGFDRTKLSLTTQRSGCSIYHDFLWLQRIVRKVQRIGFSTAHIYWIRIINVPIIRIISFSRLNRGIKGSIIQTGFVPGLWISFFSARRVL